MEMPQVKGHPWLPQPQLQPPVQYLISAATVQQPLYQANPLVTAPVVQFPTTGTLPSGWTQYMDDVSGCNYYVNSHTGESSWTLPNR